MLVSYLPYKIVPFIAINTAAESLGYRASIVRLLCCVKVLPLVCFVCRNYRKRQSLPCSAAYFVSSALRASERSQRFSE